MAWGKKGGQRLYPAAGKREPRSVWLARARIKKDTRFFVHTHLPGEKETETALPSPGDLKLFFRDCISLVLKDPGLARTVRNWAIAVLDRQGRVTGYTVLRPSQKLLHRLATGSLPLREEMRLEWLAAGMPGTRALYRLLKKTRGPLLVRHLRALGVQVRFRPMPGYRFDAAAGTFVPVQDQEKTPA